MSDQTLSASFYDARLDECTFPLDIWPRRFLNYWLLLAAGRWEACVLARAPQRILHTTDEKNVSSSISKLKRHFLENI